MTEAERKQPAIFAGPRRDEWRTPKWLREKVKHQYDVATDLAACRDSTLSPTSFYTKDVSFLASAMPWRGVAWMNPPFSEAEAFFAQVEKFMRLWPNLQLVAIYKANLETAAWQKYILPSCSWVFAPSRRVAYEPPPGAEKSGPQFASLLIGWNVPVIRGVEGHALIVKGQ